MSGFVRLNNVYCDADSVKSIALKWDGEDGSWDVIVRYKSSSDHDVCAFFDHPSDAQREARTLIGKVQDFRKVQTDS